MKNILILGLFFALSAQAKYSSVYTMVGKDNCALVESSEHNPTAEIDFATYDCAGFGGYALEVTGADIRYNLQLKVGGENIELSDIQSFHDMGSNQVEWLYEIEEATDGVKTVKYKALIHRINYSDINSKGEPVRGSMLFVTKLNGNKSCTVAKVKEGAKQNDEARSLAEQVQKLKCLF